MWSYVFGKAHLLPLWVLCLTCRWWQPGVPGLPTTHRSSRSRLCEGASCISITPSITDCKIYRESLITTCHHKEQFKLFFFIYCITHLAGKPQGPSLTSFLARVGSCLVASCSLASFGFFAPASVAAVTAAVTSSTATPSGRPLATAPASASLPPSIHAPKALATVL